jgi:hypothetical protein
LIAPDRARVAACDLLADYGTEVTGSDCAADEEQVAVTVELTVRLQLLGIVPGMGQFTMRSTASAEPVTAEDQ